LHQGSDGYTEVISSGKPFIIRAGISTPEEEANVYRIWMLYMKMLYVKCYT